MDKTFIVIVAIDYKIKNKTLNNVKINCISFRMKKIIFFTASYPYNNEGEDSLIEPELKFLKKYFKITIVPFIKKKRIKKKINY